MSRSLFSSVGGRVAVAVAGSVSLVAVAVADDCIRVLHLGSGPGKRATDQRVVELGDDLSILNRSQISLADGITTAQQTGPVIEAKFELDDNKNLSLSLYPTGKGLDVDAERNVFQELSGDPAQSPFQGSLDVFKDQEHLTRSARDLTLVQLSRVSLLDAVNAASDSGWPFWAIPTIRRGRAGYGVYTLDGDMKKHYSFVDGGGSDFSSCFPDDLGTGPGAGATDQRGVELGNDVTIVRQSKIGLLDAINQAESQYGPVIEAKFELADDGKSLSLSIYTVNQGLNTDAERNHFFEASGDPTVAPFAPTNSEFVVPDAEHLTRSARDLTLVQTAGLNIKEAVTIAQSMIPDGFVFWAIPTIRDTRAGYGVYVLDASGQVHYFFVS
jgi:hypothetical protein